MNDLDNIRGLILSTMLSSQEFGGVDLFVVFNSGISKEWFKNDAHRVIFEVISLYFNSGRAVDETIILPHLRKGLIQNPEETLLEIMSQKQVPQNILMEHIATLRESFQREMLHKMNADIIKALADENITSSAISQMVQNQIDGYASLNRSSSTKRLSEVRKLRKLLPEAIRIKTGIPFIDTVLTDKNGDSGIRNEGLFFISGLKQSGKTFVLTRIIENVSKNHPVMFGSLEFGQDLYDENIESQQKETYFDGDIENIFMFDDIYDVNAIIAEIRLQHKLFGIKLVALDSMMRMTNSNPDLKTDERRLSELFSKLGKLSKELKVPIIIVVQSSKEDLKSSMISVKGSMNADHEAYVWFHLMKTKTKDDESELRTVIWNKNKDTHKHPRQNLMFVPQTSDFYRVEIDEHGNPSKALDKYRRPHAKVIETTYEDIQRTSSKATDEDMGFGMNMPFFN